MKHFLYIALLVPAIASATTVWKGDFETGNLSQWSRIQSVASDRLQVVTDVVREGSYALKATVRQGDNPIRASGNRNEVVYLTEEEPGTEYFYKWSTLFPESFPSVNSWQLFAQWHQEGCCGSPPLEFYVVGEEMFLRVGGSNGRVLWSAPMVRGRWHNFVLHVKWSSDPDVGFVEMYKDGELAVPQTFAATQFGGERNYLKLGLYRDSSISQVGVVYHDGFAMGTHLHDVMPPPPPPPVAVAPTPEPAPPAAQVPTPVPTPSGSAPPPTSNPSPQPSTSPTGGTTQPQPSNVDYGQAQGCGASTSGGMPVLAAAALLGMALLTRRRHALARSRARNR